MESFTHIGKKKSVGYLPLHTIESLLHITPEALAAELTPRGLVAGILSTNETCIKSGALFAFEPTAAERLILQHASAIAKQGWPLDTQHVIRKIFERWYDDDHEIMPLIRKLYGEVDAQ